jgi:hypothetical protein
MGVTMGADEGRSSGIRMVVLQTFDEADIGLFWSKHRLAFIVGWRGRCRGGKKSDIWKKIAQLLLYFISSPAVCVGKFWLLAPSREFQTPTWLQELLFLQSCSFTSSLLLQHFYFSIGNSIVLRTTTKDE